MEDGIAKAVNESIGITSMPNPKIDLVRVTANLSSRKIPIIVGTMTWENIEITQSFNLDKIRAELLGKFPNIGMSASVSTTTDSRLKRIFITLGAIASVITIGIFLSGLVKFP